MYLSVHIERIGDHLLVRVAGDVDLETAGMLADALVEATSAADITGVIIDVAATTFFGASGLTALVSVAGHGQRTGFSLVVVAQRHSMVRRVITLASLTDVLPVAGTVREAQHLLRVHLSAGG
ncbi:STAS domain-containing protein [Actinophytocola sp. KF-1]|jgi:anti-anti-sigma factor